ncbi:MAG: hypothetical protein ACK5MV_12120 [Aminipila sp.]
MTYCLAWKKEETIFIIADSITSSKVLDMSTFKSKNKNSEAVINTFGEIQGLYGNYYMQEGLLKIYKITENIVICFSGVVSIAYEILEYIYSSVSNLSIYEIIENITNNYSGQEIELIIAITGDNNQIYYFDGNSFTIVNKCAIGNGSKTIPFSTNVYSIINNLYFNNIDKNDYLAKVLMSIQCYSLQIETLKDGFGGTFYGLYMSYKVKFQRDLEYYIFDDDIKNSSTISIISRKNSIFSSSDINKGTTFFINRIKDLIIWNDLYFRRSIDKSLNTKNAFYYCFFSKSDNVIMFLKTNGSTRNIYFQRWIKRKINETLYAYGFNPDFIKLFNINKEFNNIPKLVTCQIIEDVNIPFIEIKNDFNQAVNLNRFYDSMDFDFTGYTYKNYNPSMIKAIKEDIQNYHNLVLIDFQYMCDAIDEIINACSPIRYFSIDELDLRSIVNSFMKVLVADEFDKYRFVIVKSKAKNREILNYDMVEYFRKYSNCLVLESNNYKNDFKGTLFELTKNFYLNDNFFILDKFVIICDDLEVNNLLVKIVPEFNFWNNNPDIILVRNLNGLSNMDGRFRYIVVDNLVITMLGMTLEEYAEIEAMVYKIPVEFR